ncbi:hypothetical protein P1X15_07960 [Runella sp. MFBS21]|uniref:hypothetical protein n=1 Tax=Runella sp. MFBS21 TaxID=3034018 RepID=UPI0023F80D17|nr:hypothetical protein [Runella sp. MFBS21]MDF7817525.1 hypothetical protein [Runella sp. MFBS21]
MKTQMNNVRKSGVGQGLMPLFSSYLWHAMSTLVILLGSFFANAQTIKRTEIPTQGTNAAFHTISLGNKGVVLVSQIAKNAFNIQKYNPDLERDWSLNGTIEDNLDFVKSSYDGQSVYLLFTRNRTDFYQVVKVGLAGFMETFFLTSVDRFQITDFQTLGYSVFMAGTVRDEPMLLYTNLASKQSKVLPGVTQANTVIQSVDVDTTHHLVNVCYAARKGREIKLISRTFDEYGQSVGQIVLNPDPDYSLLNGRLFMLNDSTKLMIGTYGFRNMQGNNNSASQGLFLSKIVYDEVDFTQYHSFTDFKNFFNFMSEREQERMQRKIERKKESGTDVKLNYRLLVHDIIEQNGNYLISGEVFYPEYRNNMNGPYGMSSWWGSPMMSPLGWGGFGMFPSYGLWNPYYWDPWFGSRRMNNGQVFNGFVYTHAIVAGFNPKGELLWDNSLPFDNVRSMELKEKIRVKPNPDQTIEMLYSNKGAIKAKVFEGNKVLADRQPIPILTADMGDRVRQTTTDEVLYWYDNYYLAFGYQRITGDDGRRNVFYMNKISF